MAETPKPEDDVLDYLVARKFHREGDAPFPPFQEWITACEGSFARYLIGGTEREVIYRRDLERKGIASLTKLLLEVQTEEAEFRRTRAELEDQKRFFSEPSANGDFDYWSSMPRWSLEEATALSLGKAPEVVSWETIKPHRSGSPFVERYAKRRVLVFRAFEAGELSELTTPGDFIAWTDRRGHDVPVDLRLQVTENVKRAADYLSLEAELSCLREEVKQLRSQSRTEKPLGTTERKTLLKIIIGMAVTKYNYKKEVTRQRAAEAISDALGKVGVPVTSDIILKRLREGAELLPEQE